MLARNAKEYLQHRTPTAWLEALSLQHELEVMAEILFLGVAYNRQLGPRFEELKEEVNLASDWFAGRERTSAELNSKITILTRLAAQFKAFNQIDEELACLNEVRILHTYLWRVGRLRSLNSGGAGHQSRIRVPRRLDFRPWGRVCDHPAPSDERFGTLAGTALRRFW